MQIGFYEKKLSIFGVNSKLFTTQPTPLKLAILILNWNGKTLLKRFLPSVIEHSAKHDIYVVDNASEDGSVEFVISNFPEVKCVKLDKNYGYAGGYNKAVKQIDADIYCLLNSDVRVTKHWINPVLKQFETHLNIGVIQPKILDENAPKAFEYAGAAGGFIDQLGYPYCRGRLFNHLENDLGQYNQSRSIFWASGACFFVRQSLFNRLNGFDELFFAHMEEIDFCWRAQNIGEAVWFTPESTVYHVGGASLNAIHSKKTFFNFRNSLFTLTKNTPQPLVVVILLRLILDGVAGLRFLIAAKPKHTLAVIKAHFSYYITLPKLLKFRCRNTTRKNYSGVFSIVWCHYIQGTKTFSKLKKH